MRAQGILAIAVALSAGLPADALPADGARDLLGRRNPFRPLISAPSAPPAEAGLSTAPVPEGVALRSKLERLEYVGIVYDASEAIAAVTDGERTWFVRKGDRLEGAVVTEISPQRLVWSRSGRLMTKPLRREGGY